MLIDYLEEAAATLGEKERAQQAMERQLRGYYSKDIREEIVRLKAEVRRKRGELLHRFYESLEEFRLLKRHYPGLLDECIADPALGKVLSRKRWLLDFSPAKGQGAARKLDSIRKERHSLREAAGFLNGWVGKVDAKSLAATWPAVSGIVKAGMERDEALQAIKDRGEELRREGWLLMVNEPMILSPLRKLCGRLAQERREEQDVIREAEMQHGRGTVAEYGALEKVRGAHRKALHTERMVRHLLLSNPAFLSGLKKQPAAGRQGWERLLREIAGTTYVKKIDERAWLAEMKGRVGH